MVSDSFNESLTIKLFLEHHQYLHFINKMLLQSYYFVGIIKLL
jgi:hypothetical protein